MVTKKTRWLSAIAAVIMLVSMLAGIVVPAGAESGSAILTELQKKYDALRQEDFVEIREETVEEMRDYIADLIVQYGETTADHERMILDNIGLQADENFVACNMGNLKSDLIPRYSAKKYYEEMGYESLTSTYYISDVADWAAAAASNSLFVGITLLVTSDIDFENQKVEPLTSNTTPFQGVLDGQGHTFKNMIIEIGDTEAEKSYRFGGLVADLTGTIKNLGLEGGEVNFDGKDVVGDRNEGVGSFSGHIGKNGLLQNCWSTMTITNKGDLIADGKNGVAGLIGWGNGGAIDNCFFAGTVNNTGDSRAATDLIGYTDVYVKVYNSIGAGTLNCGALRNPAAVGVHYTMYDDVANLSIYNTYGVGKNAIRHRANYDPYAIRDRDENGNNITVNYVTKPDTVITSTKDISHKYTPEETNAAYTLETLEEAVWAVNSRFDTTHQSVFRDYIISIDDNGKLYMAKNEGAYRRVIFEGAFTGVYYFKEGSKVHLLNDLNMMIAESIAFDKKEYASSLDGYELTIPAGDIVLSVVYSLDSETAYYATELTKLVEKYEKLDFALFDCEQLLKDWMQASKAELAKSEKDVEMLKVLVEMESGEEGFAKIMALLPGIYPSPKDYDVYQVFNETREWSVANVEDWLVMIEMSKTNTFEGDTFHILNDIDFEGQRMDPLSFNQLNPFQGTIDGHGNEFKNIKIKFASEGADATIVEVNNICAGMIGFLGEGAVIRNFGVDSGTIVSERANMQLGTFGQPQSGKNVLLEKVWSGVQISATGSSNEVSGLAANPTGSNLVINGGYFYGSVVGTGNSTRTNFAIAGDNTRGCAFYNTIGAPTNPDLINASVRWTQPDVKGGANNYGVGYSKVYIWESGKEIAGIDNTNVTAASAAEAAYKVNQNCTKVLSVAGDKIKAVFYTMKNGKVTFGADDGSDQIRKISFKMKGMDMGEMYAAAGSIVTLVCEDATSYEAILSGGKSVLNKEKGELTLANEDVTIEVGVDNSEAIKEQIEVLKGLMAKYEDANPDDLTNGDELIAWKAAAQKAIDDEDLDALILAIENEAKVAAGMELKFIPTFTQYETYKNINKKNNWAISSVADWTAMDTYADAATGDTYFDGFTFHLTQDIDFDNVKMSPLGIEGKKQRAFAGTIDGHGYGFKNVNILFDKDSKTGLSTFYGDNMNGSIGLIAFLGNCEIRDFGIYSGIIDSTTGNGAGSSSTFGCVVANNAETAPVFTRVWSGVTINGRSNQHVNGLVGTFNYENNAVKVNGFLFYGTMKKSSKSSSAYRNNAYAIYGGSAAGTPADNSEFYNVLAYPTITINSNLVASFMFAFSGENTFKAAMEGNKIKNVYGADMQNTYRVGTGSNSNVGATTIDGVNYELINKEMSIIEAAWTSNNNQPVTGQEPIYFTLKNDQVAYGTAENQIRRVVVMDDGEITDVYYKTPGETITLNNTGDYRLLEGTLSTLEGNVLTLGNEDVVVTAAECAHSSISYNHIAGTKTHTIHCNDCGKDFVGNCELGAWTADEGENLTHSAVCSLCGGVQTENCVATLVPNATDCTQDGTYTFDCCNREDTPAIGTGKADHTFNGNWTEEGAPLGKEIDKCEFCEAKLVRSAGKVEVSSDNLVAAGGEVDVIITLPYALNSATIKITPAENSKYTIQSIVADNVTMEGLAEQDGAYTAALANVQAGATITVTIKVDQFGFVADGLLDVEVTNAVNDEGQVTDVSAQAEIIFDRVAGDANADGLLTIDDPLVVLLYKAGYQVEVHTGNADMDYDGDVDMVDAVQIIRAWMMSI